ncbi:MAG: thiamine phosphate synthase [Gemmatimonadales bacterium]
MSRTPTHDFPVVHAVSDSAAVMREDFLDRATSIMHALGARGALHLRSSRASGKRFFDLASSLVNVQESTGCWLIVNDRVDVAAAVGARGAQLASHSLQVAEAKVVAPRLKVGASVHSVEEAIEAEKAGAAWCVAGTVFETPSHAGRGPARVVFVERVAAAVGIPVIAIGGVQPSDVPALLEAGAHGVATIRGAGWDTAFDVPEEEDSMLRTRLVVSADTGFVEPVTRYISAYDSIAGVERNDHPDGQRGTSGAGAE